MKQPLPKTLELMKGLKMAFFNVAFENLPTPAQNDLALLFEARAAQVYEKAFRVLDKQR